MADLAKVATLARAWERGPRAETCGSGIGRAENPSPRQRYTQPAFRGLVAFSKNDPRGGRCPFLEPQANRPQPNQPMHSPSKNPPTLWPCLEALPHRDVLSKTPTPDSRPPNPHTVLTKNVATVARRWEEWITPKLGFPTLWRAWLRKTANVLAKTFGVRRLVVAFPLQRRPSPQPPRHPGQSTQNPSPVLNKTPTPDSRPPNPNPVLSKTPRLQLAWPPQRRIGRFRPFWRTKATTSRRTPKAVLNKNVATLARRWVWITSKIGFPTLWRAWLQKPAPVLNKKRSARRIGRLIQGNRELLPPRLREVC